MTKTKLKGVLLSILALMCGLWLIGASASVAAPAEGEVAPGRTLAQQATKTKQLWITSDHSQHEILQKEFTSGPEVTKACLSCHNQAALQFHQTIHWTWRDPSTEDNLKLGKGGLSINNF